MPKKIKFLLTYMVIQKGLNLLQGSHLSDLDDVPAWLSTWLLMSSGGRYQGTNLDIKIFEHIQYHCVHKATPQWSRNKQMEIVVPQALFCCE